MNDIVINKDNETTPSTQAACHSPLGEQTHWSGVFAMTLCVFTLIALEFMPVSLLPPIASALSVTEGMAGQGIAISGVFAVLTSLFISALAGGMNRKTLLLGLTVIMGFSAAVVALAQDYLTYMIGRGLIGMVIGGFWSLSAAVAMRLVPPTKVPKALAIFNAGNALAMVLAAPFGAYMGSIIGWRGAFFCLVLVAMITLVWQWISLPSLPVLEFGTQVEVSTLSLILLLTGVTGLVGTLLINSALAHGFYQTLFAIPLLMSVIAVALTVFGGWIAAVMALLGLWGLVATAAPVGWWAWIPRTLPKEAEAAGGLMVAVIQLAIALGSTLGGVLFDVSGYQSTFAASACLLLVSATLVLMTARAEKKRTH